MKILRVCSNSILDEIFTCFIEERGHEIQTYHSFQEANYYYMHHKYSIDIIIVGLFWGDPHFLVKINNDNNGNNIANDKFMYGRFAGWYWLQNYILKANSNIEIVVHSVFADELKDMLASEGYIQATNVHFVATNEGNSWNKLERTLEAISKKIQYEKQDSSLGILSDIPSNRNQHGINPLIKSASFSHAKELTSICKDINKSETIEEWETIQLSDLEIVWIDDEYLPPSITESLADKGINVKYNNSIFKFFHDYSQQVSFRSNFHSLDKTIIIIDIVLRDDSYKLQGTRDGEKTGKALAREILKMNPNQKIVGCSKWSDTETSNWFWDNCYGYIVKSSEENLTADIIKRLKEILVNKRLPKTFIVHGWDLTLRDELRNLLVNDLNFQEPIILDKTSSVGKTIIEKIEEATVGIDLVFVLCTPDDTVISNDKSYKQARPNVLIELGYFYGRLGRLSGKVIVIKKGVLDIPTDISGVTYIQVQNDILEAKSKIITELIALKLVNE
ncbi:hypothetical protein FACS1894184_03410 [Clostridia bacterium]|nr:hypothetical protein FACS1894184_03410 [Clostridia bacterium]